MQYIKTSYPFSTTWTDYPDNISLAVIVYIMGCSHDCIDCYNPQFQDYDTIENILKFTIPQFIKEVIRYMYINKTTTLVLSGGDPLYKNNIEIVKQILKILKNYNICIYTGYEIEYLINKKVKGFTFVKCGRYDKSLNQISTKTDKYIKFASSNQKLYDSNYNLLSKTGVYYFTSNI